MMALGSLLMWLWYLRCVRPVRGGENEGCTEGMPPPRFQQREEVMPSVHPSRACMGIPLIEGGVRAVQHVHKPLSYTPNRPDHT